MRQRKIDDNALLEMLRQGKMQKEIAKVFGCSAAGVCKRIRRLSPPPKSLENLTEKERKFAIEVSRGNTQTGAAMKAFECGSLQSAKTIGSQLMDKPEIEMAINELLELHLPQYYRIRKLRTHADNNDPVISLKALDLSWKLDGSFAPERHLVGQFSLTDLILGVDAKVREELKEEVGKGDEVNQ